MTDRVTQSQASDVGSGPTAEVQATAPAPPAPEGSSSVWAMAWSELRRNPLFWVSTFLISIAVAMTIAPQLFTSADPNYADLNRARQGPTAGGIFGYDGQGFDVFARTIHGARASILVGLIATLFTTVLGVLVGLISGFLGGWVDAILARVGEVFFAIPLLLGGILFLYTFPNSFETPYLAQVLKVVLVLGLLGWPNVARLMRSSVLQIKPNDYIAAARAVGAGSLRIVFTHILPNGIAPVIVVATINLGVYISAEATLSFLGIGLQNPVISWGGAISDASGIGLIRAAPHMLLFPSLFLSLTVLAFIMLGDAVRDALDPKMR